MTLIDLSIQPGVQVLFDTNAVLHVTGYFRASGTVFTPGATNLWQGIYFDQCPAGSVLEDCLVEGSANSGIRIFRAAPEIRRCTVRNNSTTTSGGGIWISNASNPNLTVTLEECLITHNNARSIGGGVAAWMGSNTLNVLACTIADNVVNPLTNQNFYTFGGGLYMNGNGWLSRCDVRGNACFSKVNSDNNYASYGAGVYAITNGLTMSHCSVSNNLAYSIDVGGAGNSYARGGGIYLYANQLRATNCIIARNTTTADVKEGSGIYFNLGTHLLLNCNVVENAGSVGIFRAAGTVSVTNSIIYDNNAGAAQISGTVLVGYSCVQGGAPGTGNISSAPSFTDWTRYCLYELSPCVDAGHPSPEYYDRCFGECCSHGGPRNDMGAYGGPNACGWSHCGLSCPTIVVHPQNQTSCFGDSAVFSVVANGSGPLTYQWYHEGVALPGQTSANLILTNLHASDAGTYSVAVWDNSCGIGSDPANLIYFDACVNLRAIAGLTIYGQQGTTFELRYTTDPSQTNFSEWIPLATNIMTGSEWLYIDTDSRFWNERRYGVRRLSP